MFSVLADGPRRYRLSDGSGAELGWIRGRAIGFRGFRSKSDVIAAASAGWRSLQFLLRRQFAEWPRQVVEWEQLRFVHDGAHEWVSDGRIPLARVQRMSQPVGVGEAGGSAPELAVEFVVPAWMDEGAMVPIAHVLRNVLAPLPRRDVSSGLTSLHGEHDNGHHDHAQLAAPTTPYRRAASRSRVRAPARARGAGTPPDQRAS